MRRFVIAVLVTGFLLNLTGWAECISSRLDVAGSRSARSSSDAFTILADRSRHFAVRLGFRFRLCLVRGLSPSEPRLAGSETTARFPLRNNRLAGRRADDVSGPGQRRIFASRCFDRDNDPRARHIFYRRAITASLTAESQRRVAR